MRIVSTFPSIHFSYLLWFFFHLFANSLLSILFLDTLIYFGNKVEKERIQTNVSVLFVCLFIYKLVTVSVNRGFMNGEITIILIIYFAETIFKCDFLASNRVPISMEIFKVHNRVTSLRKGNT